MNAVLFVSAVITVVVLVFIIVYIILRCFNCFKLKDERSRRFTEYTDARLPATTSRRVQHHNETDFNQEANVPIANRQNPFPRGTTSSSEQATFPILSFLNTRNNYSTNGSTGQSFSAPYPTSPRHPLSPHSTSSPPYPIQPLHPLPEATFQISSEAATYPIHDGFRPRTQLHIDLDELLPQSNPSGAASCSASPPSYAEAMAAEDAAREYKRTSFQKSSR